MSKYAKFTLFGKFSANSDYTDHSAEIENNEITLTPDECIRGEYTAPTSARTIVPASAFTTITGLFARNLDSTNYVTLSYANAAGSVSVKLYGGDNRRAFFTQDVAVGTAITLTANTAECQVELMVTGT